MTMFHWISGVLNSKGILSLVLSASCLMSACANITNTEEKKPNEPVSIFTGKPGGIKLSDLGKKDISSNSLPVNALLWRAALDVAAVFPLDDVDTFGGSVVTEWHQTAENPNQRLKLAVFVLGLELRSDAVEVQAYTQKKIGDDWVDSGRDKTLARKIEDLVLTRAREIRASSISETTQ